MFLAITELTGPAPTAQGYRARAPAPVEERPESNEMLVCGAWYPLLTSIQMSGVQINPNCEQLRAEEADRGGIAGAARQLIREPVLALAWIIVGE
jgi:hypothetical protein